MQDLIDVPGGNDPTCALVTQIARALVDHPEQVEVRAVAREESTVLRLHVCESDVGKVIGKQGRTAHSLRTILSAVSMKYHHRYTLDIVEIGEAPRVAADPRAQREQQDHGRDPRQALAHNGSRFQDHAGATASAGEPGE